MALLILEEEIYNYYCEEMADTLWSIQLVTDLLQLLVLLQSVQWRHLVQPTNEAGCVLKRP